MTQDTGVPPAGSGCQPTASAAEEASSQSGIPNAVLAVIADVRGFPADFAGDVSASIAVSLRRIADMMEEDRKPHLELLPERWESVEGKRHREWCERIDRAYAVDERRTLALEAIAQAIEAAKPSRRETGSTEGESTVAESDAPKPHPRTPNETR